MISLFPSNDINLVILVTDHEEVQNDRKERPVGELVQEHPGGRRHLQGGQIPRNKSWKVSSFKSFFAIVSIPVTVAGFEPQI